MAVYLCGLFLSVAHDVSWFAGTLGLFIGLSSGLILRRRAFPALADEQAYTSARLPTIFSR